MKCNSCGATLIERKATNNAPYRYLLSGLKNVYLVGITVMECPDCVEETPIIPRIGELHTLIADTLVRKATPLKGEEIKFLRKNAGFSSMRFAALLKIDPSTLSRVEKGKEKIGPSTDKLARIIAIESQGSHKMRELLLELADKIINSKPTFKIDGKSWTSLAA